MKYLLLTILIITATVQASAQKHQLYPDLGICGSQLRPGLSATYNYSPLKFLGVGGGVQAYHFFPTIAHSVQYVPAIYGDVRLTAWARKKNRVFAFLDIGINIYKHSTLREQEGTIIYTNATNSGMYTGIGVGYMHMITKKGWGLYWTLKSISNNSKANAFDLATGERYTTSGSRGSAVLSVGLRL